MVPPAAEILKPIPNETCDGILTYLSLFFVFVTAYLSLIWTPVILRRRGKTTPDHIFHSIFREARIRRACSTWGPWTPLNPYTNPKRESKLLRRMQSSIRRFDNSRFCHRFLSQIRDPQIQTRIHELTASCSQIQIVAYGIGSIKSAETSRLQLALALRLKEELGTTAAGPIQVFDPVLSAVECAVLVSLGCTVIAKNELCRREAVAPTLFYMPHCDLELYGNLLEANWKPAMLRRMIVLGNSFGAYEWDINIMRCDFRSAARVFHYEMYLLGIMRYVLEVELHYRSNIQILKEDEDEFELCSSFMYISWHFFELDDDTNMDCLCECI